MFLLHTIFLKYLLPSLTPFAFVIVFPSLLSFSSNCRSGGKTKDQAVEGAAEEVVRSLLSWGGAVRRIGGVQLVEVVSKLCSLSWFKIGAFVKFGVFDFLVETREDEEVPVQWSIWDFVRGSWFVAGFGVFSFEVGG
ncbi:hypothetical protein Droror1_Dr00026347 [Drosera rotundifolia]